MINLHVRPRCSLGAASVDDETGCAGCDEARSLGGDDPSLGIPRPLLALLVGAAAGAAFLSAEGVPSWMALTQRQKLAQLQPQVRERVEALIRRMDAHGIRVYVGSTKRTKEDQEDLVAAGRSKNPVSWHNLGRAIDLYPIDPETGDPDLKGKNVEVFRLMAREAEKLGFRQLAFNTDGSKKYITTSKGKVWDAGHLEYRDGMTLAQAVAREGDKLA